MDALIPFEPLSSYRALRGTGTRTVREAARDGARAFYAAAYERVVLPLERGVGRGRLNGAARHRLDASQWADREGRDAAQLGLLRAVVEHAGRHVPYWRELFTKVGFDPRQLCSAADLEALPLLTNETLRERAADLRVEGAARREDGGAAELRDEADAWRDAARLRAFGWAGYRAGMPVVTWGRAPRAASRSARVRARVACALRREVFVAAPRRGGDSLLVDAARLIARVRPHAIVADARAIMWFARWVLETGHRDWPDAHVVTTGDPLAAGGRAVLERVFGTEAHAVLLTRGATLVGAECELHEGFHVPEETVIVEVLRGGQRAPLGAEGEVVVTDLRDLAAPLIRYATGVRARSLGEAACACGRTLRRIAPAGEGLRAVSPSRGRDPRAASPAHRAGADTSP